MQKFLFPLLTSMSVFSLLTADPYKDRFEKIYREGIWGFNENMEGWSGGGSELHRIRPYLKYLLQFIQDHNIKSVVDLGCGDWMFSRYIDWGGIEYIGYDVVQSVIEKNINKYASKNIHFFCANFLNADIPHADLMICKHVLQHMHNRDVFQFITLLSKFKHCLILEAGPVGNINIDNSVEEGFSSWDDRGIDLRLSPFYLKAEKVLEYAQAFNSSGVDILIHVDNSLDK